MKHTSSGAQKVRPLIRPLALLGALALASAACDDDGVPGASGRDTRLEWPVDSGGFSTPDGGAPESGSGDGHTPDGAAAHDAPDASTDAHSPGDAHTDETADTHGDNDAAGLDADSD